MTGSIVAVAQGRGHHFSKPPLFSIRLRAGLGVEVVGVDSSFSFLRLSWFEVGESQGLVPLDAGEHLGDDIPLASVVVRFGCVIGAVLVPGAHRVFDDVALEIAHEFLGG